MTHDLRIGPLVIGLLILLLVAPLDVSAELYADLYTGAVFTKNTDLTIASNLGSTATYQNLQVNNSWTAGGRAGYWLEGQDWLGFGLDVFFFHVKAPNQMVPVTGLAATGTTLAPADWSLPVIGIGFDVLRLRAPLLRSEEFTHGRLQPYLSAGPALFVTWAETPWNIVQPKGQHDTDVALGAKAEGGVTFLVTKTVGLFTEYRFTHFTSKLNYQNTTSAPASETYKTTWDSHQVIGGISFRF
jgi:opacity protein-like surface antigen